MAQPQKHQLEIACQQVLLADASVFSVQWVDLPAAALPRVDAQLLLTEYFAVVRRCTLGLIRPTVDERGVRFRVVGTELALLSFNPASFEKGACGSAARLFINGGLLVQAGECDRGEFALLCSPGEEGCRVTVQLSDYCPLLLGSRTPSGVRKLLYGWTQSYLHKIVTVRYLSSLYRTLTGTRVRPGVIKVRVREGKEI